MVIRECLGQSPGDEVGAAQHSELSNIQPIWGERDAEGMSTHFEKRRSMSGARPHQLEGSKDGAVARKEAKRLKDVEKLGREMC
jgi:hypothetical protein